MDIIIDRNTKIYNINIINCVILYNHNKVGYSEDEIDYVRYPILIIYIKYSDDI